RARPRLARDGPRSVLGDPGRVQRADLQLPGGALMVSVAILGAGFMGSAHAANYRALEGRVCVKTVASRTLARAAQLAETVRAEATTDLDAAIRDQEVDAVD